MLDIIPRADELHIILPSEQVGNAVDVIYIVADDAHPRDIRDVFPDGLIGHWQSFGTHLVQDALGGLQAGFNVVDRIIVIPRLKLLVQDLELSLHFLDSGMINLHLVCEVLHGLFPGIVL